MTDRRDDERTRFGLRARVGAGVVLAAAVVVVVLLVAAPSDRPTTAADAAALANRGPTARGPAVDARHPALLDAAVQGVAFPAYRREFGWRATGRRSDRLGGHATATVFYEHRGGRIAYTIVAGDALKLPGDATALRHGGISLSTFAAGAAVTWVRRGHTCVLTGARLAVLLRFATWRGAGAIVF
ncbi:MAG: hypothetical protein QOJ89_2540 [bacterium]